MEYTVSNYATKKQYAGMNLNLLQAAGIPSGHSVITLNQFADMIGRPLWPSDDEIAENAPKGFEKSWALNQYKDRKKAMFMNRFNKSTKGHWVRLMGAHNTYFVIDTEFCKFDNTVEKETVETPVTTVSEASDDLVVQFPNKQVKVSCKAIVSRTLKDFKEFLSIASPYLTAENKQQIDAAIADENMQINAALDNGTMQKADATKARRRLNGMVRAMAA